MHNIEVEHKNIKLEYPETGFEFNKNQFLAFAGNVFEFMAGKITYEHLKVKLTYAFLNMKRTANVDKPENAPVIENVLRLSRLNDAYFKDLQENKKTYKVIDMVFFNQLISSISIKGKMFYGPSSALTNTTYGEYIQALTAFNDYSKTGEIHFLDTLIATIYRPKQWFHGLRKYFGSYTADPRRKFNSNLTQHYIKQVSKLGIDVKYAIYLFFASCQHFIATNDSLDIGGGNTIDLTQLFNQQPNNNATTKGLGVLGTLYTLAETRVFGNVKETAEQNTYDVFAFLVNQAEKIKELQKKQNNAGS